MNQESKSRLIVAQTVQELFDNGRNYFNGFLTNFFFQIDCMQEARVRNNLLVDKKKAETDETIKQLIPYIVVRDASGLNPEDHFLVYQRKPSVGDERLQTKFSIGIGGHIEESDIDYSLTDTIEKCMAREVREELGLDVALAEIQDHCNIIGYVNEDTTEVGRVHFGIVYLFDIPDWMKSKINIPADEAIGQTSWMTAKQIQDGPHDYEVWSQLIIPSLSRIGLNA